MTQKISVLNKRGEKLVGLLHDSGSAELVILCHGLAASKEDDVMVNLSAALERERISAFRFDFSGNGESEGTFEFANYRSEAEDIRSVVEHFKRLHRPIIAVLGHSKGGNVVLLYASKYHDIPGVINASGRYDLKRGLEERLGKDFLLKLKQDGYIDVKGKKGEIDYRVTEESMIERLTTNMHQVCLGIDKNCRVLTVHGSADEVIPVEDAHEFAKIIPNHELKVIQGANHVYSSHHAELAAAIMAFLKELLMKG